MPNPAAGVHYPRSLGEFQAWFRTDADCLDYLEWLRWPDGFVCSACGHRGVWRLGDLRLMCPECGLRTSVTAGTMFDKTRTPLTVWFTACWLFATQKDGISALALQRALGIGSYQTAWAMLHRLRSVLVRPGRELLGGRVEVDETYIGGIEPGLSGGRAKGKKALVGIAVERVEPRGFGRCRMAWLLDGSGDTLRAFLTDHVQQGATVITDGWGPYRPATKDLYVHERVVQPGTKASELLPGVHRIASLVDRWLLGTHQGAVNESHLSLYLDEFVFRFNRRHSRSRGMVFYRVLELAAGHDPVRYSELILNPRSTPTRRTPPATHRQPESLDRPPADRPWRKAPQSSSG
jgi:ISXO2 transposase-like protein/transposase-like zinc ribbon protein